MDGISLRPVGDAVAEETAELLGEPISFDGIAATLAAQLSMSVAAVVDR
jgi:hypothetical protein